MNILKSRREFLESGLKTLACLSLYSLAANENASGFFNNEKKYYKKAYFYKKLGNKAIKCEICPNSCVVSSGGTGKCKVKRNIEGEYYTIVYSRPAVIQIDNVEKAPLYHFMPNAKMLSIATAGCNLTCKYCQNWQFSQSSPDQIKSFDLTPQQVVNKAKQSGCQVISFFYTEPAVYYEYMYDIALIAKKAGLKTIMVTAGYINLEPLRYLSNVIDAFTVGLKGFNDNYYRSVIGGNIEPVKNTLKFLKTNHKHIEIVNLVVPTLNDNQSEINSLVKWVKTNLSNDIPLHFAKFAPQYKLQNLPPTSLNTLNKSLQIAKDNGLKYAYIDNLPGHEGQNTYCPTCKKSIVRRVGFKAVENSIKSSRCVYCGAEIYGKW
ncbi:MAG: AmmeMemoRadiSam system radical SAM enzyme [Cyanobacteriota bacterium]